MSLLIVPTTDDEARVWSTTLEVSVIFNDIPWVLVGAQMVMLLEHEAGAASGRTTGDVDVIVDIRAITGGSRAAAQRLLSAGFDLSEPRHPYRFTRGLAQVDLLAPDHLGERVDLVTVPPWETAVISGGSLALHTVREVSVEIAAVGSGVLPVPSLAAALVLKVRSWEDRRERRDVEDLARLLGIIEDVEAVRSELQVKDRTALAHVAPLTEPHNPVYRAAIEAENAYLAFVRITT